MTKGTATATATNGEGGTGKRMTKAQIVGELAEKTGLTKKQIGTVFEALQGLIKRELGRRGPQEFIIPDNLLKLRVRKVAAQKNAKYRNPSTGEIAYKDRPASKKVRATPLKKLKDLVL